MANVGAGLGRKDRRRNGEVLLQKKQKANTATAIGNNGHLVKVFIYSQIIMGELSAQ
jgi:hypothetical protein